LEDVVIAGRSGISSSPEEEEELSDDASLSSAMCEGWGWG